MGIGDVKRSTLAYANQNRSYEIYQDLFYHVLSKLHGTKKKHKFRFKNPLYSIDASTIDLCLKLFPWANFRKNKAGIKLHVKLDHSGYIPSFISVTDAKTHENNAIKEMPFEKGDILVFDKGYSDYKQYSNYCRKGIYFVTRIKRNASYEVVRTNDVEKYENINFDKIIKLTGFYSEKKCPEKLRIIKSYDPETKKTIVLLTNNMAWSPRTIAKIYKDRWQIEVFFKTIKQNLKIKSFFGTSRNAVLTQVWISMIAFLLLKFLADTSTQSWSVTYLMAVIPILLFMKKDIWIWLNDLDPDPDGENSFPGQMELGL